MQASFYLVLYTVGASLPLLICLIRLFWENGHISFLVPNWYWTKVNVHYIWWFLLVAAFAAKTPVYGLHL